MSDDTKKENAQDMSVIAVQNMMRTQDNREYIWAYLQSLNVFESIFNIDHAQFSYNAGLRDAGLRLVTDIKLHAPEQYLKMLEENING